MFGGTRRDVRRIKVRLPFCGPAVTPPCRQAKRLPVVSFRTVFPVNTGRRRIFGLSLTRDFFALPFSRFNNIRCPHCFRCFSCFLSFSSTQLFFRFRFFIFSTVRQERFFVGMRNGSRQFWLSLFYELYVFLIFLQRVQPDKKQNNPHCCYCPDTLVPQPDPLSRRLCPHGAPGAHHLLDALPQTFGNRLFVMLHPIAQVILPLIIHSAIFLNRYKSISCINKPLALCNCEAEVLSEMLSIEAISL